MASDERYVYQHIPQVFYFVAFFILKNVVGTLH